MPSNSTNHKSSHLRGPHSDVPSTSDLHPLRILSAGVLTTMPSTSAPGPLSRLWFKWKALRLPWRKTFLVGFDLSGNTFWEFKDAINTERMRRIVQYSSKTHYADVKISRMSCPVTSGANVTANADRISSTMASMAPPHTRSCPHNPGATIRHIPPGHDETTRCKSR